MALLARGQVTITTVEDGANAVSIYVRSHAAPSTPTGASPSGWNVNPDSFADSFGVLWVSDGLKDSDGNLTQQWSEPRMYEPYNANLLWNFPWSVGKGSLSIYRENGFPNYREMHPTPFGYSDIVWKGVSNGTDDPGGGFNAYSCTIDHTKPYRMSCWFKRTSAEGSSFFGANSSSNTVQVYSNGAWAEKRNFYFWSGDLPRLNKWYLLVGYMYGSGATKTTADSRAGVYDPTTGKQVLSFSNVSRNYPNCTTNGIRVYQYYCHQENIPAYFWRPRVDLLDGREPSIEELLKKSQDGEDGAPGRSVIDTDVEYAQSTSSTTAPTSGWQATSPAWVNGRYIWQRVKTTFSTGEVSYSPASNTTGHRGDTGRGITSITEQYYLSTRKTSPTGGAWSDYPYSWSSQKYIWTRSKITYSSGSPLTAYTEPYCDSSWEAVNDIKVGTVNLLAGASNGIGWGRVDEYEERVFKTVLPANMVETYIYSQYLPVLEIDATYTLSFDIKAEGDFNKTEIFILSNKYTTNGAIFNSVISGVDSAYKRVSILFTPDSDYLDLTDVKIRFDIDKTTSDTRNGATLWIKEPMLVKGNIAPESFIIPTDDIFEQISNAQAVADAITAKAESEGWATKLTHIDENGIFTGQLSANTVTSIRVHASQITAGTIDTARLNTEALKSTLITASNINALTLEVVRGTIGGWSVESGVMKHSHISLDSKNRRVVVYGASSGPTSGHRAQLYYNSDNDFGFYASNSSGDVVAQFGSANRVAGWNISNNYIYKNSVYLGSDGSIYNGTKWKLANDGSGLLANSNIKWDTSGNVTFGSAVTLLWSAPIEELREDIESNVAPRITKLTSTGIYTGTLTATQVNAVAISASSIATGTLSAERIASGSISATKLDAASIKSSIINTDYINGLSCTFTKGKIGGWNIGGGSITCGQLALSSSSNRIAVYGSTSSSTSGHRVQLYYASDSNFGFYATDSKGSCVAQLGSSNHIAGWRITTSSITKNSVSLGSDGTISNGSKWRLSNDGSGSLAAGKISWNSSGAVTFSSAVSMLWKDDIEAAKASNFGYPYYQSIVIHGEEDVYYPVIFKGGDQNIKRDILIRRGYNEQAPNSWYSSTHKGGLIALLKTNFGGWGGIGYSWEIYDLSETYCRMFAGAQHCGNSCMFAIFLRGGGTTGAKYHIYSDQAIVNDMYSPSPIPPAPQIAYDSDLMFSSGSTQVNAPAPRTLTAAVEKEIRSKRFIYLAQSSDNTLTAHPLTYIGQSGIYTGTLTANQVNAVAISASSITTGTLSTDRLAAGSITSSKLNASSIKSDIINTSYINGLTCTFTKGSIGGWSIGADNITAGSIGGDGQMPMQIRKTSTGSGYWYSGAYRPFGISMTWHKSSNAGHIVIGQVAASGNSVKSGFMGIQMMSWDHHEYFCLSANYTLAGRKEVYNRIAGWAFDSAAIWKSSVYLGSDGSIYHSSNKWRLSDDGSGQVANGNIVWDASGNVTFGSSVSLNWTQVVSSALATAKSYTDTRSSAAAELASAMAYGKMLYRDPTFSKGSNGTHIYNNLNNGAVTVTRTYDSLAPNDSKYILKIVKSSTSASPECGGFSFHTDAAYRKIYITRIYAKIPAGRSIKFASNNVGTDGSYKWLTDTAGTGDWKEYVAKVTCGTSNFASTNFYYLSGSGEVTWDVAYATVFDITSVDKSTTTIDINGIYTGTINAKQVTTGIINANRIDVDSIKASILTATNINALTLTTSKGKIGGWNITSSYIYKNSVCFGSDGSIYNGAKWKLNNDGSGQLANGNISWNSAGVITAKNALFTNVCIEGSVRNAYVLNTGSSFGDNFGKQHTNFDNHDNVVALGGGMSSSLTLPWTLEQSGRRISLINYKWGNTISAGYRSITAPTGKYFYEDGIAKDSIRFSREIIELIGYGDDTTFFGWIVVNRLNLMTSSSYGKPVKVLAQGRVTGTSASASITYKTFDNTTMSVSRLGTGKYKISYSSTWGLSLSKAMINLTGYGYAADHSSAPIKASVYGVYSTYMYVNTSDDAYNNDGSFFFQIINTNDWSY